MTTGRINQVAFTSPLVSRPTLAATMNRPASPPIPRPPQVNARASSRPMPSLGPRTNARASLGQGLRECPGQFKCFLPKVRLFANLSLGDLLQFPSHFESASASPRDASYIAATPRTDSVRNARPRSHHVVGTMRRLSRQAASPSQFSDVSLGITCHCAYPFSNKCHTPPRRGKPAEAFKRQCIPGTAPCG